MGARNGCSMNRQAAQKITRRKLFTYLVQRLALFVEVVQFLEFGWSKARDFLELTGEVLHAAIRQLVGYFTERKLVV